MEYSPSFVDGLQADVKPSYSDSLMHEFDDKKYGLPRAKKYPMPDIAHVRSAIKFFNYVDRAHEKELAKAILARMHEYGIDPSDVNVGDTNRFKKYLPQTELKHHGIKGMHWGVRRYQNRDGTLTSKGKARKGMSESTKKKLKTAAKVAAGVALAGAVGYGLYKSGAAGKAIGAVKSYKSKKPGPSGGKKYTDFATEAKKKVRKEEADWAKTKAEVQDKLNNFADRFNRANRQAAYRRRSEEAYKSQPKRLYPASLPKRSTEDPVDAAKDKLYWTKTVAKNTQRNANMSRNLASKLGDPAMRTIADDDYTKAVSDYRKAKRDYRKAKKNQRRRGIPGR